MQVIAIECDYTRLIMIHMKGKIKSFCLNLTQKRAFMAATPG